MYSILNWIGGVIFWLLWTPVVLLGFIVFRCVRLVSYAWYTGKQMSYEKGYNYLHGGLKGEQKEAR